MVQHFPEGGGGGVQLSPAPPPPLDSHLKKSKLIKKFKIRLEIHNKTETVQLGCSGNTVCVCVWGGGGGGGLRGSANII